MLSLFMVISLAQNGFVLRLLSVRNLRNAPSDHKLPSPPSVHKRRFYYVAMLRRIRDRYYVVQVLHYIT